MSQIESKYLTVKEAAQYLKCSTHLLDQDRCKRKHGIPYLKWGKRILYVKEDLDAYMQKFQVAPNRLED